MSRSKTRKHLPILCKTLGTILERTKSCDYNVSTTLAPFGVPGDEEDLVLKQLVLMSRFLVNTFNS